MGTPHLKKVYNSVMAQAISDTGKYLFAGNRFGDIFVQSVEEFEKVEEVPAKVKMFPQGKKIEINSLCFHQNFLIVGAIGVIYGLKWDEETCKLSAKRKWQIIIPLDVDAVEVPDVNFMWLRPNTSTLYAGCGDNIVYKIDLEDGSIVRTYIGHKDYIHGVSGNGNDRIYSASEDGTVRFWCDRDKDSINMIEPAKSADLNRPELGKWIGAIGANDNWLICGGGPKPAIWHIPSLECTQQYPFAGSVHACDFVDDSVIIGGECNNVRLYALSGQLLADVPIEHTATYSITWQMEPIRFMSIAGYSNKLHILSNFRFLDTSVELYGNVEGEIVDEHKNNF